MEPAQGHDLVERIRQTDYAAFEHMHQQYYTTLFRMAVKKMGDEDEAFDLVQGMFIEIWEKRETLHVPNALDAWLRNRLWFKLSGYFRTKGFREKHVRMFGEYQQMEQAAALNDIEVREINQQYEAVMELVKRTIDEMPQKMKTVFLMSRNGDTSIKDIAEELQLSPKTVKNQVNLAMNRIRHAVSGTSLTTAELLFVLWLINP
jgi:RNA polymerase sigma factor (sigma-70 family)